MPKRKGYHIEWYVGMDTQGDNCVYLQWVKDETGNAGRFLSENEISESMNAKFGENGTL